MSRTFAFRPSTDARHAYFVLLHTGVAPDVTTWQQYVEAVGTTIAQSKTAVRAFAVTDGGGPDAAQRRALAPAFTQDHLGAMTHVFATSMATRGIVTAFHWVARARAMAHSPEQFLAVCEQCGIPARAVLADLLTLQRELPPVTLLRRLKDTMSSVAPHPGRKHGPQ